MCRGLCRLGVVSGPVVGGGPWSLMGGDGGGRAGCYARKGSAEWWWRDMIVGWILGR